MLILDDDQIAVSKSLHCIGYTLFKHYSKFKRVKVYQMLMTNKLKNKAFKIEPKYILIKE